MKFFDNKSFEPATGSTEMVSPIIASTERVRNVHLKAHIHKQHGSGILLSDAISIEKILSLQIE